LYVKSVVCIANAFALADPVPLIECINPQKAVYKAQVRWMSLNITKEWEWVAEMRNTTDDDALPDDGPTVQFLCESQTADGVVVSWSFRLLLQSLTNNSYCEVQIQN